jgi:hypothetical protein
VEVVTLSKNSSRKERCHSCAVIFGQEKAKITSLAKYGSEHHFSSPEMKNRLKEISQQKYGVDNPAQSKEVQAKMKATSLTRYGFENAAKSKIIQERTRVSNLTKYGVEYSIASEIVKERIRQTNRERYGYDYGLSNPQVREKIASTNFKKYGVINPFASKEVQKLILEVNLKKYGVPYPMQHSEIAMKSQQTLSHRINAKETFHHRVSKINLNWQKLLEEQFACKVELEARLGPYFADLRCREIFIEINPTVTHNHILSFMCLTHGCPQPCGTHSAIPQDYHFKRATQATVNDKQLIQVYDWTHKSQFFSLLSTKLKRNIILLPMNKLTIREIDQAEVHQFLIQNYGQSPSRNELYCYGIFDRKDLLAVAIFERDASKKKAVYKWASYIVKTGYAIDGASDELWNNFRKQIIPDVVIGHIDYNHTTQKDTFLTSLGFEELAPTGPALTWHNQKARTKIVGSSLGEEVTDTIMFQKGFLPVCTAGDRVFRWDSQV